MDSVIRFLDNFLFELFSHSHFRECEVFCKNHPAPFSKVITFHKKEPFELEAFYTNLHEVPYPDPRIGKRSRKIFHTLLPFVNIFLNQGNKLVFELS